MDIEPDDPSEAGEYLAVEDDLGGAVAIIVGCRHALTDLLQAATPRARRAALLHLAHYGGRLVALTMALLAERERDERLHAPLPVFTEDVDVDDL